MILHDKIAAQLPDWRARVTKLVKEQGDIVLDIGSSAVGFLMFASAIASRVVGIEFSREFLGPLSDVESEHPNVKVIFGDAFSMDLTALGGPPPNTRMRLFFAAGDPADAIGEFIAEHNTDLVAIAWVPGWEPDRRTTMRRIIEHAPAPLLIFPSEEPERGMVF